MKEKEMLIKIDRLERKLTSANITISGLRGQNFLMREILQKFRIIEKREIGLIKE